MTRTSLLSAALAAVCAGALHAQSPAPAPAPSAAAAPAALADTGRFIVRRGADTVAVETFGRRDVTLTGTLLIPKTSHSEEYVARIAPDETIPMIEINVLEPWKVVEWEGIDTTKLPKRPPHVVQQARAIFRGDSVAVDNLRSSGIDTRVFGTQTGALPYLNLSFALLQQALRRATAAGGQVPFFNLAGTATAVATVTRAGADSAKLTLGPVEMDFRLDRDGRILAARIPSQNVTVERQ
jgi:hypothetical protein